MLFTTSAPRSTVVHVEGEESGRTVCGRTITDDWSGMYTECATGPVSCIKCARFAADEEEARRTDAGEPQYRAGERVGILTGLQSGNPSVGSYGTVIRSEVFWTGTLDYVVHEDGQALPTVFPAYLLTHDTYGDPTMARQACMDRHPAGKGMPVSVARSILANPAVTDARVIRAAQKVTTRELTDDELDEIDVRAIDFLSLLINRMGLAASVRVRDEIAMDITNVLSRHGVNL